MHIKAVYALLKDPSENLQSLTATSKPSIPEPDILSSYTKNTRATPQYDLELLDGIPLVDLSLSRATRDIEFRDADVLRGLVTKITESYENLQRACATTVDAIISGLSLCCVSIHHHLRHPQMQGAHTQLDCVEGLVAHLWADSKATFQGIGVTWCPDRRAWSLHRQHATASAVLRFDLREALGNSRICDRFWS